MAKAPMGTPLARSNIVIFFISMSLVMLLGAGVYASNRLLTHWLLKQGLELDYSDKNLVISKFLSGLPTESKTELPGQLTGLRLSAATSRSTFLTPEQRRDLIRLLQPRHVASKIQDIAVVRADRGTTQSTMQQAALDWETRPAFLSSNIQLKAELKLQGVNEVTAIPDMNFSGKFGPTALIVIPNNGGNKAVTGIIAQVSTSSLMASVAPVIWSVSAAIGALCLTSFLFAGTLLWMRFRDQLQTNRNIHYLAHHDTLTGLPNRAVFNARLTEALRLAQAKASNIGVMLVDVDRFKDINDAHGHGTGDVFLQIVAERLKAVFSSHLVARLSGDEFAVLLTTTSDPGRMTRLAADMINATDAPCSIDGRDIKISLSIGLARATDGSWRSSRLLHCADLALYKAKHSGRATFAWYTPELDAEAQKRKEIEDGLVKALKFNQFKLLYQPQYSLKDGQLKGYEALIRWEHPTKGMIRPDIFIPVAEDTGLIEEIGTWVLNKACEEALTWPDQTRRVAVNMSPAQFVPGETQKRVAQALQNTRLDPSRLEIEVTESLLISNTDAVLETLRHIRDMGVSIAMDDFGTGYSSLSYLSLFPFDKIKIDKAFMNNLGQDASTDAIVTSIVGLGRSLDVTITAEGVETEEQAVLLRAAGCDLVQGYLYGRPDTVSRHEANCPPPGALSPAVTMKANAQALEKKSTGRKTVSVIKSVKRADTAPHAEPDAISDNAQRNDHRATSVG